MQSPEFTHIIQNYIKQVLKIQRERSQYTALTEEELRQIAIQLGLTDKDWQYIQTQFEAFWGRGKQYSKYAQWDEAIQELEQAVLLKPNHEQALFDLAQAYQQRWILQHRTKDKKNSELYAKRCLLLNYQYEPAVKLISELRNTSTSYQKTTQWLRLILFVLVGLAFSLIFWLAFKDTFLRDTKAVKAENIEPIEPIKIPDNQPHKIKVELEKTMYLQGYRLDIESSILNQTHYHLRASIYHKNKNIEQLVIQMQCLGETDQTIYQKEIILLDTEKPEAWAEECVPFVFTAQQPELKNLQKVIIKLQEQKVVEKENINPEEDLRLLADSLTNNHFLGLIIRERNQVIEPLNQQFTHQIVLQYENTGANPLKHVEIEIAWFDTEDKLISNETLKLLTEQEPMLKPKQKRAKSWIFKLNTPKKYYKKYYVSIIKME
ncbi:MAG: tetratricopeptide repeat protein [Microscillaceae bacterium]|nr:tetratricopeptide repeat protein [Microscillaceae bacterium]MDW8460065.1 hypothetical protein [Cytophagales bacterium]